MGGRWIRADLRFALVALLALSGCWLQVGADAGHTQFNGFEDELTRANVASLHPAWSADVPGTPTGEPIVSGGRAYVTYTTTTRTEVRARAFDVRTGDVAWDQLLASAPAGASTVRIDGAPVAFVGGRLWTGSYVEADMGTGRPWCSAETAILDPSTGAKVGGDPGFPSAAVSLGPVVARTVFVTDGSGCISPDDTVLEVGLHSSGASFSRSWSAPLGSVRTPGPPMPTLTDDQVLVAHGTTVDAFPTQGCGEPTCPPTWTVTLDADVWTAPVADRATGPILVVSGENLIALDRAAGDELWRAPLGLGGTQVALAEGIAYVLASYPDDAQLQAYAAGGCGGATCAPAWRAPLGRGGGDLAVGGGVVYAADSVGVWAFDAAGCGAATCSPLVLLNDLPIGGPMSLAQGRLFVAGPDGLMALAPDTVR